MVRIRGMLAVVLAGVVLLTGCTQSGDDEVDVTTAASSSPGVLGPELSRLPIEAYLVSGEEAHAYNAAEQILTNQCLQRFGFAPDPTLPEYSDAAAAVSSFTARRYLLVDAAQAASYGYHTGLTRPFVEQDLQREVLAAKAKASAPTDPATLAARSTVLNGDAVSGAPPTGGDIPDGGCIGEANRALRGDSSGLAWSQTAIELQQNSYDESLADPRVQQVFASWSTCMAEAGYDYPTPVEANNDPSWSGDTPTEREIATAVADVACKGSAQVVSVWSGVETEVQQRLIDEHLEELRDARTRDEAALAAAARVMQQARP